MAFKRSAVRSRLSPPRVLKTIGFQDFFFCILAVFPSFQPFREPGRYTPVRGTLRTRIVPELGWFQCVQCVWMRRVPAV